MRIVAGALRGRRLQVPSGRTVRPTSERLRESLFNILAHGAYPPLAGARVIDLFAGSGALGIEALSRGAAEVVFVETARTALACLECNIAKLEIAAKARLLRLDAIRLPWADAPADIAFLDPPYGKGLAEPALTALAQKGWLPHGGIAVVETGAGEALALPAGYRLVEQRDGGAARLWFLRRSDDAWESEGT